MVVSVEAITKISEKYTKIDNIALDPLNSKSQSETDGITYFYFNTLKRFQCPLRDEGNEEQWLAYSFQREECSEGRSLIYLLLVV